MKATLTVLSLAAAAIAALAAPGVASASGAPMQLTPAYHQAVPVTQWNTGQMAGASWMIKAIDYAEFPAVYGNWAGVLCGESNYYGDIAGSSPQSPETGPCEPGQWQTFASAADLETAAQTGDYNGQTMVLDMETWSWTPAVEQADPAFSIQQACTVAKTYGIKVIVTPEGPAADLTSMYTTAAKYCYMVEDQAQSTERVLSAMRAHPAAVAPFMTTFQDQVSPFLKLVRAVPHHAGIMLGLATDPGGVVATAAQLEAAFKWAHTTMKVQDYWMNAAAWESNGGSGYPQVAEAFFKAEGYTG